MKKASIVAFSLFASTVSAFAQTPEAPSPGWGDAMPPGPDTRVTRTRMHTLRSLRATPMFGRGRW